MNALTDWLTSNRVGAKVGDLFTSERVLNTLGNVVESPIGKAVMAVDKVFEEGYRENVSATLLASEMARRGDRNPVKIVKQATSKAEDISYGEALAYTASRDPNVQYATKKFENIVGQNRLDKAYKIMPLLNPEYDLLDESQRLEAQDSAAYQLLTGLTDLGLEIRSAQFFGIGIRGLKNLSRLSTKLDAKNAVKLGNEMESAAANIKRQLEEGIDPKDLTPTNGPAVHLINALNTKNVTDLMNGNPMIASSLRAESLAKLVAAAGDDVDAITYLLMADKGVPGALEKLATVAPRYSDFLALSRETTDIQQALRFDDIDDLFVIPTDVEKLKFGGILDDILKSDSTLGGSWLNWYNVAKLTPNEISWSPTKYTFIEQMRAGQYGLLAERLTGRKPSSKARRTVDLEEGLQETIIADGLSRPFRIITLSSLEFKPRGYIQLTGLRPLDSVQEISAGLAQSRTLNNPKFNEIKKDLLDSWINTPADETSRALRLAEIEVQAGVVMGRELAKKFGIADDINVEAAIADGIRRAQAKRDALLQSGRSTPNGVVSVEKGTGEVLAINETFKSFLPSNVPMLDFRLLEREIASQLKAASTLGKAKKVWDRKGGIIPIDPNSLERAFSASVLIRPGYIPKNSIFEPAMRLLGLVHLVSLPKIWRNTSFKQELKDLDTGNIVVKDIDVMAPNTPGGNALKNAIDPAITQANVTQAGIFERFSRGSGVTQAIDPKDVATSSSFMRAYYKQYAKDVNILKNDPVASLIMRGLTDEQIVANLLRNLDAYGEFSDLNRLAQSRIAAGEQIAVIDRNVAERIVLESREKLDELIPDKAAQKAIVEDTANFNTKKARELLDRNKLPALDVDLPFYAGLANQGMPSKIFEGVQRTINSGFRGIAKPEMFLFRSPYGRYYGNQAARILFENAKRNGVDVTNDLWQNVIRPISQEYALRQVEDLFYAVRRMNNVQYYSRFLTAFPNAMFNSIKFWSKAGLNNPYSLVFLEKVRTSPWNVGMVVDEDGNPLTKEEADDKTAYLVFNTFSKQDEISPFIYKMNVPQLNFLINGPSPNWLNQAALNTVIQTNPSVEIKLKEFMGEKLYNQFIYAGVPRGIIPPAQETEGAISGGAINFATALVQNIVKQFFIPLGIQDLIEVSVNEKNQPRLQYKRSAIASTIAAVHNARLFNWEMNNPDGPEPLVKDSIAEAMKIQWWAVARRIASPIGITAQPQSIMFRQEWDRIEKKYTDNPELLQPNQSVYEATTFEFGQIYGDTGYNFLISAFEYKASIAPQQEAIKRYKQNAWLENWVGENPNKRISLVGIVTNPVIPGEYNAAASAYLRTEKIAGVPVVGQRKTFAERLAEAEIEDGWREYSRIVKEKDLALASNNRRSKSLSSRVNADIGADYRNELNALKEKNKPWAEEFGDSQNRFPEALNLIDEALKQKEFIQSIKSSPEDKKLWESIEEWKQIREEIFPIWNSARPSSRERRALKEQYESEVFRLIQQNTYFADFAARYFVGDPMMDVKELMEESIELQPTISGNIPTQSLSDLLGAK
jgi:hypothetical protein